MQARCTTTTTTTTAVTTPSAPPPRGAATSPSCCAAVNTKMTTAAAAAAPCSALSTRPFGSGPGARRSRAVRYPQSRLPSPGFGCNPGVGRWRGRLLAPSPLSAAAAAAAGPSGPDGPGRSSPSGGDAGSSNQVASSSSSSSVWPSPFATAPALSFGAPPIGYPRGPARPAGAGGGTPGDGLALGGGGSSASGAVTSRACEHLLFDFNTRYMTAASKNLLLASLSPDDATRTGGGGGGGGLGGGALAALLGPLGGGGGGGLGGALGGGGGGGLAAMRAFFDLQVELEAAAAAASGGGGGGGPGLNLVKAAALVALDPNVQGTLDRVESIAAMVGRHLRPGAGPEQVVHTINSVLFDFYRFGPARERYYHPEASSLARLLQYKTGSPTLLGILYIAVAERVGLRVAAVSLPSHFLVRPLDLGSEQQPLFIDPYGGGRLLDVPGVAALLHAHLHLPPPQELAAEGAALAALAAAGSAGGSSAAAPGSAAPPGRAAGAAVGAGAGAGAGAATPAAAAAAGAAGGSSMDWYFGRRAADEDEEGEEGDDGAASGATTDYEAAAPSDEEDDDGVVPMYEPGAAAVAAAAAAAAAAAGSPGPSSGPSSGSGSGSSLAGCWFAPYLAPVGKVEVLLRLLRGLREVYYVPLVRRQIRGGGEERRQWQAQQALSVLRLLRLVAPGDEAHVTAEALCLVAAGRPRSEARELLRGFLAQHPEAQGAVQTLFLLEAEDEALGRIAAMEAAAREKAEREAAAARSLKSRLAGLRGSRPPGFNPRDPHSVMSDPAFFSRMYGRLWDDNWWISAMLDQREDAEDDKKGGGGAGDGKKGGGGSSGGKK
ncbi:hypothetical protein HYH02_012856 [Chlamydomonas schloesseri]|uniref:Protein SirB1 N-terminal domain-containing protein n=1 Tax=Chlamydomonas schloesseri TaxID=2026947 RepID=A0A835SWD9_9CHLO|nr:hypothetical protein HYH02_012856 [Chlamydomonas schloesseri]|eukprot:KAG2432722.1 hypothetical protein HYH02_012856 [Chlamydomonas schloesseri]